MDCINHAGVSSVGVCVGCAESFCQECLVEIEGQRYCGSCKIMALKGTPDLEAAQIPCQEANEALRYAIFGIFCFGIILEPMAIIRANKARRRIAANPRLAGSGKVTATYVIAGVIIAIWILGILVRFAAH